MHMRGLDWVPGFWLYGHWRRYLAHPSSNCSSVPALAPALVLCLSIKNKNVMGKGD